MNEATNNKIIKHKLLAVVCQLTCALLCVAFAGCLTGTNIRTNQSIANASRVHFELTDNSIRSVGEAQDPRFEEKSVTPIKKVSTSITFGAPTIESGKSIVQAIHAKRRMVNEKETAQLNVPATAVFSDNAKIVSLEPIAETVLVSETFVENDVQEALQILAAQAKAQIIVDDMVNGVTSAVIENETFESALERVLLPLGYVFRKVNEEYLVGTPDPASNLFPLIAERFDYHTSNLAPSELLELLPDHFKPFVRTSEKRNLIIIEAPPQIAESVINDLNRSDQPVKQVELEVMICVYSPDEAFELGVDLTHRNRAFNLALAGLKLAASNGAVTGVEEITRSTAALRAMASKGHVSIRATPHVMAKDGEKAQITIAKETFFSVQPTGAGSFFRQEIEKIEAGITLDIVPVIRGNRVTLNIERAEVSEGIDNPRSSDGSLGNAFPTINRRHVSTTVCVNDQETITIGGLVQRQVVEQTNKIPVLGDLPLIGKLFRRIDQKEQETEVIIFITPRVVHRETQ